ncbi:hypothetical protein DH86_00000558, partial [Scytalidium sp. 3C]
CTSLRGSSRVICFTAANKGYIASLFRSQAFSSSKLSSKPNDEALRDSHNVVAEENCTENGNESSGSVIHPDHLPISPLVDSKVKEARERWRTPKAAPSQNPTPFQQLLAKNPYALALATPVRRCAVTRVVLPSFFLQDFSLISNPNTGEPWYMPRSLTGNNGRLQNPESRDSEDNDIDTSSITNRLAKNPTPTLGPRVYTLSRKSLLKLFVTKKSGYEKQWQRFPSQRMLAVRRFIDIKRKISWRDDMDEFVLELMRRRVVEDLI